MMKRIHVDKFTSVTTNLVLSPEAVVSDAIVAAEGYLVAARVLDRSEVYGQIEDRHGRMVQLHVGDVIVGALGNRKALHGHAGTVPSAIAAGDVLHLLNLGGVVGACHSSSPKVGPAVRLEILGAVLAFPTLDSRQGVAAHLAMGALPPAATLGAMPPVVFVTGTCMNAGKTRAAAEIVLALSRAGRSVAAAKLTGVAARKDVLAMLDCGAVRGLTFVDAGLPSTTADNAPAAARAVLAALAAGRPRPDVIVAELGDGLLGEYGVMAILRDPAIQGLSAVHVCCANDPVGAMGAMSLYRDPLGRRPDVFSGPVTDNAVGIAAITERLGVPAINACDAGPRLGATILTALDQLATSRSSVPCPPTPDVSAPPSSEPQATSVVS